MCIYFSLVFALYYGAALKIGEDLGVVEKRGSHYNYKGESMGSGKKSVTEFFKTKEGKKVFGEIWSEIRAKSSTQKHKPEVEEEDKPKVQEQEKKLIRTPVQSLEASGPRPTSLRSVLRDE